MWRLNDERGAVAVVVAILMVALLGFAAIGVDVANMASDKQQLQNGADAAALAVAQSCAGGDCGEYQKLANSMAKNNRNDLAGSASVDSGLTPADGEVTVETEGVTNHWFAPIFGTTSASSTISADATAVWGQVKSGTSVLPIAISFCEIEKLVKSGDGTYIFTGGPAGYEINNPTGKEVEIILVQPSDKPSDSDIMAECPVTYVPGGFSWITSDSNQKACTAWTEIGQWVGNNTGNNIPSDCTYIYLSGLIGKTSAIPIFEVWQKDKTLAYKIAGYAGFTLTGFNLDKNSVVWGDPKDYSKDCAGTGNSRCIKGFFTEVVDLSADLDPSGLPLGSTTVKLVLK